MEAIVKKYQQKFRKVREELGRWNILQSRLLSEFRAASAIIEKLQVIENPKYYATLNSVTGINDALMRKQLVSLEVLLSSMNKTLNEIFSVVSFLKRQQLEGLQVARGASGTSKLSDKQLQQKIGIKPALGTCLDGFMQLYNMHNAEYLLKSSIVSALAELWMKPSCTDLGALEQLLVDQPNIPPDEVEAIFDIIFAEEIP